LDLIIAFIKAAHALIKQLFLEITNGRASGLLFGVFVDLVCLLGDEVVELFYLDFPLSLKIFLFIL
jgi:hypothetical protein